MPVFAIAPALPVVSERRKRPTSHPEAVTAQELLGGKGGRRRNKGDPAGAALPARPPCVSQRQGEDQSSARRNGEMLLAAS